MEKKIALDTPPNNQILNKHTFVESSCDSVTGSCVCPPGFTGTGLPIKHGVVFLVTYKKSSVRYCTREHWTSHYTQVTRKTRSCLTGNPVYDYQNLKT